MEPTSLISAPPRRPARAPSTSVAVLGGLALVAVDGPDDLAVVDLASAAVVRSFSAGAVTHAADLVDGGDVSFTDTLVDAPESRTRSAGPPTGTS